MVIDPAAGRRPLALVDAADSAAVKIAQLSGVSSSPARSKASSVFSMPTGSPMSRQNARTPMDKRNDRIEKHPAEQRRHRIVRHQFVERARAGVDPEQHLAVVEGGEAEGTPRRRGPR